MKKYFLSLLILIVAIALPLQMLAQGATQAKSSIGEPLAIAMLSIIVLLTGVILLLSNVVFASYEIYKKKAKDIAAKAGTAILAGLLLFSNTAFAQEEAPAAVLADPFIGGLTPASFYILLSVIILQLIIILFLVRTFRLFAGMHKAPKAVVAKAPKKKFAWLEKLNNTKSVDAKSEADISLNHDYDGIGELDNPTPPWWQWSFVLSIIFAVVYMYTHHVSKTAPLQLEELAIANAEAEILQKAYLANSANKIDENTVTYLSENTDLLEGKTIFTAVCAACHGADGGGIVGPNLTDDYWVHGGSVKDIFKVIKYGVPEKGMKSWKDDYSPKKIAQLASYIHSIKGTKPASPKAAEGDLYTEDEPEESNGTAEVEKTVAENESVPIQ